jgi:hypothetical protein
MCTGWWKGNPMEAGHIEMTGERGHDCTAKMDTELNSPVAVCCGDIFGLNGL